MLKFLEKRHFFEALKEFCAQQAGLRHLRRSDPAGARGAQSATAQPGRLDAIVERNAYGRQIDSAILTAETSLPGGPLEMVFIRAPRIVASGPAVEVLARRDGFPVLVRQGNVMAATFHPELSTDRRVHQAFVEDAVRQDSSSAPKTR